MLRRQHSEQRRLQQAKAAGLPVVPSSRPPAIDHSATLKTKSCQYFVFSIKFRRKPLRKSFFHVINFLFWNRYVKPQDLANGCTIGMHPIHPNRQKSAALSRQSSNMFEKLKLMIKIVWIFMKTLSKWRTNAIFCFLCFFVDRKIYSAQGILLSSLDPARSLARRAVVCLSPRLRVWKKLKLNSIFSDVFFVNMLIQHKISSCFSIFVSAF